MISYHTVSKTRFSLNRRANVADLMIIEPATQHKIFKRIVVFFMSFQTRKKQLELSPHFITLFQSCFLRAIHSNPFKL